MKDKHHTISSLYQNNRKVPFIKLTGKWLEDLGFEIGNKIKVSLDKNSLILTKIN